jgi:hypothetical protein
MDVTGTVIEQIASLANKHYGWDFPTARFRFEGHTVGGLNRVWVGKNIVACYDEPKRTVYLTAVPTKHKVVVLTREAEAPSSPEPT